MRTRFAVISVLTMLLAVLQVTPALGQPANDNFTAANAVSVVPFTDSVGVSDATIEPGEPVEVCAPIANTVWYAITLDEAETLLIDTMGSGFDTVLAVWQGTDISALSLVKCVDDTSLGVESRLLLAADAGETYLIQAGAFSAAPEAAVLSIAIDAAPKSTGKPVIYRDNSRGNSAQAYVDEFNDGWQSWTSVSVFDGRAKFARGKPYITSEVFIYRSLFLYDEATGVYTSESWSGSAPLEGIAEQIDNRLRRAHVNTTVTMTGLLCEWGPVVELENGFEFDEECEYLGPLDVAADVSWEGQGSTYRYSFTDRSSSTDGYRTSYASSTIARDAAVSGSLVAPDWYVDLDGAVGTLQRDSSRYMTVYRGGLFI